MSDLAGSTVFEASGVAIDGRALLIEGPPGSGKSSLALALMDLGAQLIGDDAVTLRRVGENSERQLIVSPPPNTAGLIEVRGVGIARYPTVEEIPLALILKLGCDGERLPEGPNWRDIMGAQVPWLPFEPGTIAPARRARIALELHGLKRGDLR